MLFVNLLAIIDFVKMKSYNKNIEKDFDKIKAGFTGCKKEDVASNNGFFSDGDAKVGDVFAIS